MKESLIHRVVRIKLLMSNWALLGVIFAYMFVWPFFGRDEELLAFNIFLSLILVLSMFAVEEEQSKRFIVHLLFAVIAVWLIRSAESLVLIGFLRLVIIVFFFSVVLKFIKLVYKRKVVDKYVVIEAVNGYLLLGIGFSLLIYISRIYFPDAFNFDLPTRDSISYDPIYFSFVTLTTLGYGDKLPISDVAKAISLLITLSGQFYLVTVMSFIVGKMLSKRDNK